MLEFITGAVTAFVVCSTMVCIGFFLGILIHEDDIARRTIEKPHYFKGGIK